MITLKIKKKIVIFILILSIFSAAITPPKKTEAASIALGYAAFKVGVSFTAFATYATWFYANGYTMPVQELITAFANKYYDYSLGVYTEKPTKLNVLEKLNLYTSAVLTGNVANIPNAFDLQAIRDSVTEDFPQKQDMSNIIPDIEFNIDAGSIRFPQHYNSYGLSLTLSNQGFYEIRSDFQGKLVKILYSNNYPDFYYYADLTNYGWVASGTVYYPTIRIIAPSGQSYPLVVNDRNAQLGIQAVDTLNQTFRAVLLSTGTSGTYKAYLELFRDNYVHVDDPLGLYSTAENTYSQGTSDWVNPYPVYYPALNSKAATTDELLGLMNVDEYLQREIARMIEEQDRTKERPLVLPTIEAGKVVYPGTQSGTDEGDTPSTGIDVPAGWWDRVFDIPRDITTGLTTWWDNTLMPGLDTIKEKITEIPTSITNITDLTQDISMEQIDFTRLKLDGIITKFPFSIPFDYVKLLKNFKRDPIAPDLKIKLNTHYFNIDHDIGTASINKYIVFFRWFALTIFVYALMMITRKVIKW